MRLDKKSDTIQGKTYREYVMAAYQCRHNRLARTTLRRLADNALTVTHDDHIMTVKYPDQPCGPCNYTSPHELDNNHERHKMALRVLVGQYIAYVGEYPAISAYLAEIENKRTFIPTNAINTLLGMLDTRCGGDPGPTARLRYWLLAYRNADYDQCDKHARRALKKSGIRSVD